jgi:hypothetical protein
LGYKLDEKNSDFENREEKQEKIILKEIANSVERKTKELEKENAELKEKLSSQNHNMIELKQENSFLTDEEDMLYQKTTELEKNNKKLQKNMAQKETLLKESEQSEKILESIVELEKKRAVKYNRKYVLSIVFAVLVVGIVVPYSYYANTLSGLEYRVEADSLTSGYVVNNLRGDTIDTWLSWRLVDGNELSVNIINKEQFPEKIPIIEEVVLSKESIDIDDSLLHKGPVGSTSTYYVGWLGALETNFQDTKFYIPKKFQIIDSATGAGDITIYLTKDKSGDGYSGFTKSIADESQNQILKSNITIYEVDKLSNAQFETILRHEFGHALGLAHSTAPEDLMHPTIETDYPYISECDVDAIISLYDGQKTSEVVCQK